MRATIGYAVIGVLALLVPQVLHNSLEFHATEKVVVHTEERIPRKPTTLLFVGDIMLGRDVETRMNQEGARYPFAQVTDLLMQPDVTIGNFEGVVSEPHVHAPGMTFQFSIRSEYLKVLRDVGFDILSLANNHSADYGTDAYLHTRVLCAEYGLVCMGEARSVSESAAFVYEQHGFRIGFLFGHTTWGTQHTESLVAALETIATTTDIQIAYIHWGDEYELVHNEAQETLAKALIDAGADAVVGHHPHVVQDVALYNNAPIIYSLGNFIFDQYWNTDVQTGLGVVFTVSESPSSTTCCDLAYQFVPFTSVGTRNQPRKMDPEEAEVLYKRILSQEDAPFAPKPDF